MNARKLFPEKKLSKKGFLEFLDKKGFYIVLILCIAIVGVTLVLVSTSSKFTSSGNDSDAKIIPKASEIESKNKGNASAGDKVALPKSDQSSISIPAAAQGAKEITDKNNVKAASGPSGTIAMNEPDKGVKSKGNKSVEPDKKLPIAKKSESPVSKFIMPVFGDVTFEYAEDKLVYSKTLEEWRTHSGIDLAADRGAPVKAVADGVVSEIKNDPRYGVMVFIHHSNGIETVYANLASDEMVTPNQKVKQGDVVGAVGNTATFESSEQSHLHFEVLKNNKPVNPLTYLPQKQ